MKISFIGDVHGKIALLKILYERLPIDQMSIQVGDMGCGFVSIPQFDDNRKFIRGNHDNPAIAREHVNYLGDYGYLPTHGLFYLSGAWSIDRDMRIEGRSWWRDEQLSYDELKNAIDIYETNHPKIVVSHDCPSEVSEYLLSTFDPLFRSMGVIRTKTGIALQQMLDIHKPDLWVFGHYHVSKEFWIKDYPTKFVCLNELECKEFEIGS